MVREGEVNQEKLREIKAGVAALRGLEFKGDVPVEVETKDQMKQYFERDLERDYGDEKLHGMSLAYAKLGLFPKGLDLKKSLLDFYSAQVAAFYDPEDKKLILPENMGGGLVLGAAQLIAHRDILGEMVLAHELTHALQDQHFSLRERLQPSDNDDKTIAFHALAEGDATVSGFAYVMGGLDEESIARIDHSVQASIDEARSALADIPQAILEELLFEYYGGVEFVSRVLDQRGWLGVDLLYASPPLSTQQVLHPEKYFSSPQAPVDVALKDSSALFGPEWKEIENNVMGELMVRVLLQQFLPEKEAERIARGWGGDRFIAFQRGQEVGFLWATVWDSAADAEDFLAGYQRLLEKKYAGSQEERMRAAVERRGGRVLVIEGVDQAYARQHSEEIWRGLELRKEPFRPPYRLH